MRTPTRTEITLCDASGKTHRAYIFQHWLDATTADSNGEEYIPGLKECRLADGTPLNFVDQSTFKNVLTEELLTRRS